VYTDSFVLTNDGNELDRPFNDKSFDMLEWREVAGIRHIAPHKSISYPGEIDPAAYRKSDRSLFHVELTFHLTQSGHLDLGFELA